MKNLLFLFVALLVSTLAFAQDGPKVTQLGEWPDNEFPIGGVDGAQDNGNTTIAFIADNLTATPPTGMTGTNQGALNDEFAASIAASGGTDDQTSTEVNTAAPIVESTVQLALEARPTQADVTSQVNASSLADRAYSDLNDDVDDADADATNEAQAISKTGTTVTLTAAGGAGGGTFEDNAIADTERDCTTATGATVTLPAAVGSFNSSDFTINGIHYQGSAAATTPIQVTGTTLQAGANLGFPIEAGDEVCWDYAL